MIILYMVPDGLLFILYMSCNKPFREAKRTWDVCCILYKPSAAAATRTYTQCGVWCMQSIVNVSQWGNRPSALSVEPSLVPRGLSAKWCEDIDGDLQHELSREMPASWWQRHCLLRATQYGTWARRTQKPKTLLNVPTKILCNVAATVAALSYKHLL